MLEDLKNETRTQNRWYAQITEESSDWAPESQPSAQCDALLEQIN